SDAHVYVDDGISGAEFANRPGFLRLMNALKPRPTFQVLIMSEESRLGREAIETAYALKQLVTAGVRVFFYLEDRERTLDSPTDKIMLSLTAFADELEREKARQRTYDAMVRKARAGHVTGGRTFGYDNVRETAGVKRTINTGEAAVVRRIFDMATNGHGLKTIAWTLNEDRAPSPRAQQGRPNGWCASSVREVLYRPLYKGAIVWNQSRKRDRWGVRQQRPRPDQEHITIPAPELAIVSTAVWDAAHAQMTRQRERYSTRIKGASWGTEPKYLLTGLLRCAVCGSGFEARSRSHGGFRRVFYGCAAYHRRGCSVCRNSLTVPMEIADAEVITSVKDQLLNRHVLKTAVERATQRLTSGVNAQRTVARELATIERELANLAAAVSAGGELPTLIEAARRQLLLPVDDN
ncbi:MAG TPA: recombinase family protein, partial [Vicinamibacterales bacterium]|nr:recombinase family protein [Vicinamibacterales bacterium]